MFTKIMFALAIVFAAASGALAATKEYSNSPSIEAQSVCGWYLGTDPAARVRFNNDCETVMQNQRWW
jgi:hypothetical protein